MTPALGGSNPLSPGFKIKILTHDGLSPSGKAMDSDSIMRRFESCQPSFLTASLIKRSGYQFNIYAVYAVVAELAYALD